jgi:hypothetical protein
MCTTESAAKKKKNRINMCKSQICGSSGSQYTSVVLTVSYVFPSGAISLLDFIPEMETIISMFM